MAFMALADISQFIGQRFRFATRSRALKTNHQHQAALPPSHTEDKVLTVMNLIAFEQDLIQDFFECTAMSLKQAISSLAQPLKTSSSTQSSVEDIFCLMHQIKGDAAMLNMEAIAQQAHEIETLLQTINTPQLKTTDLRQLITPLKSMIRTLRDIKALFLQLSEGGWHKKHANRAQTLALKLEYLIKKVALDCDKRVMIVNDGYSDSAIPTHLQSIVAKGVTQLARNAVFHGLETEAERIAQDKTPYGCFHIRVVRTEHHIEVITRDDGRGIDTEKVRQAALRSSNFDAKRVARWQNDDVLQAIFHPGLSTQKTVTQHAGRGVGMDVIKQAVEQHHGSIQVKSQPQKFTEFTMRFPVKVAKIY